VGADFGAVIDMNSDDLDLLVPHRRDSCPKDDAIMPVATRGYLIASIKYASLKPGASPEAAAARAPQEECGLLVYLTTTFFKELSADLHDYRQSHPEFPHEPTSEKFFDEKQFEAYRELGYQTAWRMMRETSDTASGDDVDLNGVRLPPSQGQRGRSLLTVPVPARFSRGGRRDRQDAPRQGARRPAAVGKAAILSVTRKRQVQGGLRG